MHLEKIRLVVVVFGLCITNGLFAKSISENDPSPPSFVGNWRVNWDTDCDGWTEISGLPLLVTAPGQVKFGMPLFYSSWRQDGRFVAFNAGRYTFTGHLANTGAAGVIYDGQSRHGCWAARRLGLGSGEATSKM